MGGCWVHGGWLVFDLWELCSSFLRKKHHPAPMLFCQLKHANYIGSPPTEGTSSPKQNRPTKQFFVRISTLYFQKTSKKGGVFGEFTTLASPPKKKKITTKRKGPDPDPTGLQTLFHLVPGPLSTCTTTTNPVAPLPQRAMVHLWHGGDGNFFGVWKTFPIGIFSDQAKKKAFFGIESWYKS